jgi:hypothetical protein
MGNYTGTATVLAGDGSVFEGVEIDLVAPDEPVEGEPWFGTLRGDFDAFSLMEGQSSLRLANGREAPFRLSRTDLVVARQGVQIVGLDVPPF